MWLLLKLKTLLSPLWYHSEVIVIELKGFFKDSPLTQFAPATYWLKTVWNVLLEHTQDPAFVGSNTTLLKIPFNYFAQDFFVCVGTIIFNWSIR